jgi:hypothetical protein
MILLENVISSDEPFAALTKIATDPFVGTYLLSGLLELEVESRFLYLQLDKNRKKRADWQNGTNAIPILVKILRSSCAGDIAAAISKRYHYR